MNEDVEHAVVRLETPASPVTVIAVPRTIEMYSLSEQEIDSLVAGSAPVNLTFFGICFGSAIAFLLALVTASPPDKWFGAFVMIDSASWLGTLYFGVLAITQHRAARRKARQIIQRRG